jgi:hypothetical protein
MWKSTSYCTAAYRTNTSVVAAEKFKFKLTICPMLLLPDNKVVEVWL